MKRSCLSLVTALLFVFGVMCAVYASTPEDAKALAEKAAAYVKTNGKEKGLAEINSPKGQFVKGDLYVFSGDFNGLGTAHPMQPKLVGLTMLTLRDANDKPFMKEIVDTAKTKGSGWVTYSWTNPATKKIQPKKSWVQRVEGMDIWVTCGAWQ